MVENEIVDLLSRTVSANKRIEAFSSPECSGSKLVWNIKEVIVKCIREEGTETDI
jgi:hypothetical protein